MKTLYIERSTGDCRNGEWVNTLDLDPPPERIVVGTGPGSFAGIRSALAFACGYATGRRCEVLGLPSACALVEPEDLAGPLAVVGDARQGKFWVALFDGYSLVCDVFTVDREGLAKRVPRQAKVVTPDAARIDALLKEEFGDAYIGGRTPTAEGLKRFAEAAPSFLTPSPQPLYLNPAVR
jgi:tRNA threonylcarbamoyladenosine biosynthesis protein TsaB